MALCGAEYQSGRRCNGSRFSPRPQAIFLKLGSARPEPIVIGRSVATPHLVAKVAAGFSDFLIKMALTGETEAGSAGTQPTLRDNPAGLISR